MLKVLGTGSKGNSYVLAAGDERLILDCGLPGKEIMQGLNFGLRGVVGCLITHSHKDHCKAIKEVLNAGVNVYSTNEILKEIGADRHHRIKPIELHITFKVENFNILPFEVNHTHNDGIICPTIGFLIHHNAIGKVLYVTDTYYLRYKFTGVKHIIIECNYSEDILEELPDYRARVLKSHMSLETLKKALITWDLKETEDITLVHMSGENGNTEYFKEEIEKLTGIKTYIAERGLEI